MKLADRLKAAFAAIRGEGIVSVESRTMPRASTATLPLLPRWNPDTLAGRKGLAIYAEMRLDEQVKAACTFKRDAVLSRGWQFQWDQDVELPDEEKELRKRVFQRVIEDMPGSFVDALNVIATGREFGFSLTEKVYGQVTVDGRSYVAVTDLIGRDPTTFQFYTDEHGALVRCEQWAGMRRVDIDLRKFIHYVHAPEFDRYFGRSDLREAYRAWYTKDKVLRAWTSYLEKLGGGMLVAKIGPEASMSYREGSAELAALRAVVGDAKNVPGIVLPAGIDVDVTFPSGTDPFPKAIELLDLAIAKSLLVPNLLGVSHTGQTGSFSQSQTQLESFAWTVKADADRLEACLNEQLFRDLGDQNWGDNLYPRFSFKPISGEALRWLVTTWAQLIGAGAVLPTEADEARLREILEMPPRTDTDITLAEAQQRVAPSPPPQESAPERVVKREEAAPQESAQMRAAFEAAKERVDFAVIDRRQRTMSDAVAQDVALAVAKAVQRVIGSDDVLATALADPSRIAQLELQSADVGRIKYLWQKALADAWALGRQHAQLEIRRTGRRFKRTEPKGDVVNLRDKAAQFFEANSFRMAGNVADGVRAVIQAELQNSVKSGRSPAQAREVIWARLAAKGFSSRAAVRSIVAGGPDEAGIARALDALDLDTEEQAAHYLDTLARTNLFEAMNEARYAEFTDPALDGWVVAFRYSAILDERTTEICQALHGNVYGAQSEVWNMYRPPNHYNCRSLLIPISQLDLKNGEWDGEESPAPAVEPQEGFK